jgi:nucleoid-associated protein YgaU
MSPLFQKAYLLVEGNKRLACWFNPTSLNVKRTAKWESGDGAGGCGQQTYLGGQEQALSLKLLFHAEGARSGAHVQSAIKDLYALLEPPAKGRDDNPLTRKRPPTVEFIWGTYRSDPYVVTSVDVTTELFDIDGTPLRAWVGLSMSRSLDGPEKEAKKSTNPTTKATQRRRAHEVGAGEDIALIAHHHYNDTTRWREIAEANYLDDPLRIHPPAMLIVPLEDP